MNDFPKVSGLLVDTEEENQQTLRLARGLLTQDEPVRLYSPNPLAPTSYGGSQNTQPDPAGFLSNALGIARRAAEGAPDALAGLVPPTARQHYMSLVNALAELSPGAAVRDSVDAYKSMVANAAAGNVWDSLGNGANLLTAMAGVVPVGRGLKFGSLDHIRHAVNEAGEPAFVRWSRGPKYDMKPGARSMNQATGEREAGLSAQILEPGFDPVTLARRIGEYEFLRFNGMDISPHIYTGRSLGRGGDNEPVIAATRYLGSPADDLLLSILDQQKIARLTEMRRLQRESDKLTNPEWLSNPDVTRYGGIAIEQTRREIEALRAKLERLGGPLVNDPLVAPYKPR